MCSLNLNDKLKFVYLTIINYYYNNSSEIQSAKAKGSKGRCGVSLDRRSRCEATLQVRLVYTCVHTHPLFHEKRNWKILSLRDNVRSCNVPKEHRCDPAEDEETPVEGGKEDLEQNSPNNEQNSPKNDQDSPKNDQNSPEKEQNLPENEQNSPENEKNSPENEQNPPKNEHNLSNNGPNSPINQHESDESQLFMNDLSDSSSDLEAFKSDDSDDADGEENSNS